MLGTRRRRDDAALLRRRERQFGGCAVHCVGWRNGYAATCALVTLRSSRLLQLFVQESGGRRRWRGGRGNVREAEWKDAFAEGSGEQHLLVLSLSLFPPPPPAMLGHTYAHTLIRTSTHTHKYSRVTHSRHRTPPPLHVARAHQGLKWRAGNCTGCGVWKGLKELSTFVK
mmetsp:Transcript_51994/g.105937  ORF Transcript_51994/g.105937 Transcript_51994/m.105937 type:complete len:170 (+) Transcript_51994:2110-2619(+)